MGMDKESNSTDIATVSASNESATTKSDVILFEDIFEYIGQFGTFQFFTFFLLAISNFLNGFQDMSSVFLAADVDHWCRIQRLQNYSFDQQKYIAIPYSDPADEEFEQCLMYNLPWDNYTDEELLAWDRNRQTVDVATISCDNVVFDHSIFHSTISSEWNLVCGRDWIVPFSTAIYLSGIFFGGFFSGFISDKWGRLTLISLGSALHVLACLGAAFSPNVIVFMVFRFITSLSINGAFVGSFVLLAEINGPKVRTRVTMWFMPFYATGFMVLSVMAIFVRSFVKLQLLMAASGFVTLFYYWLLPESPRWLLTKDRKYEAHKIMKYIGEVNGNTFPQNVDVVLKTDSQTHEKATLKDLIQYSVLRKWMLVFCFIWFITALAFFGITMNLGELTDSIFTNSILGSSISLPAIFVTSVMSSRLGRRFTTGSGLFIGGVGLIAAVPLLTNESLEWLMVMFVLIGRFGTTICFSKLFLYTTEVFPTPVRNIALGMCNMAGGLSTTLAPYFGTPLSNVWEGLPNLIMGGLAIVGAMSACLLPETLNRKMPDTIEEAQEIAKKKNSKKQEYVFDNSIGITPEDHSTTHM